MSVRYATEHRCGVVVRGPGLSDAISGTDPLRDNLPLRVRAPHAAELGLSVAEHRCDVVVRGPGPQQRRQRHGPAAGQPADTRAFIGAKTNPGSVVLDLLGFLAVPSVAGTRCGTTCRCACALRRHAEP